MPRIDPQQLLVCLTPLLAPNGGIKSTAEVIRLASLMEKYSKKLVSKAIYVQILKCTETDLLGQFMAAGGWNLVHTWLKDSSESDNWPFVQEILEMLLLCPVDGNRLKSNHTPKIVKQLSLNCTQSASVKILSVKLVEQWLKIAHQEKQQQMIHETNGTVTDNNILNDIDDKKVLVNENNELKKENNNIANGTDSDTSKKSNESSPFKYKISPKESGLKLSIKRSTSPSLDEKDGKKSIDIKSENKSKSSSSSDKKKSGSSSSSSSHKSSSSKSSHRDKERSSHKSSSSSSSSSKDKHSTSSKSSSSTKHSSSRDKDKDRDKRKRDVDKEQAEKDKETLNLITPLSSSKLQRIPKRPPNAENNENKDDSEPVAKAAKTTESAVEKKKPSISIEVRKGDKPKTVKTLNSQFRNHGLAEEPPPPPSRKALNKKPTTTVPTPVLTPLVTSSLTSITSKSSAGAISPTINKKIEKALESEVPERAGGVKLIKPKPMLIESLGFFDALDNATIMATKKDLKKRRKTSTSGSSGKKEDPESPKIETKPLKFYKDTLEENTDEEKANGTLSPTKDTDGAETTNGDETKTEISSPKEEKHSPKKEEEEEEVDEKRPPGIGTGPDGPPGVLVDPLASRKKRTKRSIRWRPDTELTEIRYFELDENERVNVTKTFAEQKQSEHNDERSAFMLGRKLHSEDVMVEQTSWRPLIRVDNVPVINYGSRSREVEVQLEREKITLQEINFGVSMFDSPHEPDAAENVVPTAEPITIPLDDVTGNPDAVNDFRNVVWPPPKGEMPLFSSNAFSGIFNSIPPAHSVIAPNPALISNPLATFNIGAINSSPWQHGIIPAPIAQPFLQAPPPPIIQNNYQTNSFQSRNNYNSTGGNNIDRNRGNVNNNNGSNSGWVRGNATTMRRGTCFQYQKKGFCPKKNNGCPYIHER